VEPSIAAARRKYIQIIFFFSPQLNTDHPIQDLKLNILKKPIESTPTNSFLSVQDNIMEFVCVIFLWNARQ
jgi:hypothetical protein